MGTILSERMTAEIEGDFVVFAIGMRINKPWKIHKWLPVFRAMPRMLRELQQQPDSGFLGSISAGLMVLQYWRSFEHLEAYARSHDHLHWPAWVDHEGDASCAAKERSLLVGIEPLTSLGQRTSGARGISEISASGRITNAIARHLSGCYVTLRPK
jgi:hypothetical protein